MRSLALFGVAVVFGAGCSSIDPNATTTVDGPAFGKDGVTFRPVSQVIESRCGTLDCHGQSSRPMRIYGQEGLRKPEPRNSPDVQNFADYTTGGAEPTTAAELHDNYQSMCALEPAILDEVVAGAKPPDALTLVRKPRLTEKHKGGLIWNQGDFGDVCLVDSITGVKDESGAVDTSSCGLELRNHL